MAGDVLSPLVEPNEPSVLDKKKRRYAAPQVESRVSKRATVDFSSDGDNTYCYECGISFSRPYALRRHYRDIHDSGSEWRCDFDGCGKLFKRKDIRDRHIDTQHRHGKMVCPSCSSFVRKDGLSEHLASKACRAVRIRRSRYSQFQDDVAAFVLSDRGGHVSWPDPAEDAAGVQVDDDIGEDLMQVDSTAAHPTVDFNSEIVESAGDEETGPICEAHSNETKTPVDARVTISAGLATHNEVRDPGSLSTPVIVADSPRNTLFKNTLNELFLVDDASVIDLRKDVQEKYLALEKSVAGAHDFYQYCAPRGAGRSPLHTSRARQSYAVSMGSRCTLCDERLGHNLAAVLDHVKAHIQSHNRPSLECKDCKIKFAFQLDLKLHSNKLRTGTWSLSRELPPVEAHDSSDWVAQACIEAREAFLSLLRSWESLQLRWYLTGIVKLSKRNTEQQSKYRSDMPYFLRPSSKAEVLRHSNFTQGGAQVDHHLSMNTLIQKFNATTLAIDVAPTPLAWHRKFPDWQYASTHRQKDYWFEVLCDASRESQEYFANALVRFQTTQRDAAYYTAVLELVFRDVCSREQLTAAQQFLDFGVNLFHALGRNALTDAIDKRHPQVVRFLIEHGASTHPVFGKVRNVIHYAYQEGLRDLIPNILKQGAEADATDALGITILMRAASDGQLAIVKTLLEAGASVDCMVPGKTPHALGYAASRGHFDVVQLLLNYKAPIDRYDQSGLTALMKASHGSHLEVVELLLGRGANAYISDASGRLAFDVANGPRRDAIRGLLPSGSKQSKRRSRMWPLG